MVKNNKIQQKDINIMEQKRKTKMNSESRTLTYRQDGTVNYSIQVEGGCCKTKILYNIQH